MKGRNFININYINFILSTFARSQFFNKTKSTIFRMLIFLKIYS